MAKANRSWPAYAGAAAFAAQPIGTTREQVRDTVSVQVIDEFLADSKRYLDL